MFAIAPTWPCTQSMFGDSSARHLSALEWAVFRGEAHCGHPVELRVGWVCLAEAAIWDWCRPHLSRRKLAVAAERPAAVDRRAVVQRAVAQGLVRHQVAVAPVVEPQGRAR